MNIASALLKQILVLQDFEAWTLLHKHYLPTEYHTLHKIVSKHTEKYHKLPTFEDLKFEIRDSSTREKVYALETVEVDVEAAMLLEYLKNEYTQAEILKALESYIDNSIAFEDAEESVTQLHEIIRDIESKVDLQPPSESMQRIELFIDDDELKNYLALGLNEDYDQIMQFSPRDLILLGGKRGRGKSLTSTNIANNMYENGRSAMIFTIEMDARETLQRVCAMGAKVSATRLKMKNLSVPEWERVATWWANRFEKSDEYLQEYKEHRSFDELHKKLSTKCALDPRRQIDIVYEPSLTLAKIQAELDKRAKSDMDLGVVVVDYLNQVKRSAIPSRQGQYDWTEQIEVSKALKSMAQEYEVPVVSPYQTDASGEARFAKGILDAADAAFTLESWTKQDECMTFNCVKMRSGTDEIGFTSYMDWETLKIGPHTVLNPDQKEEQEFKTDEEINDI